MHLWGKVKKEWFLVGMGASIALATVSADWGRAGGVLHLQQITQAGIALIFFLHGLALSPSAIKAGVSNWRLHLCSQSATFIIYPLLWVLFGKLFLHHMPTALAFGFCYLFVLPSTISSSVAMTSIGRGNVPGAIFNASLSSVLGVFITPLLVHLFMGLEGANMDPLASILSISKLLLLPMVAGQLLRPLLLRVTERHKKLVHLVDRFVILLIVYSAFCDSVVDGIWQKFSVGLLAAALILCAVVLVFMTSLIQQIARRCRFDREDEVAAVFCGTKKTLAAGVPMAQVIFGGDPALGMILLPIILYHPMQIFYCALLANRYGRQAAEDVKKH
ncbi:MAG: bile acid:sodium symporter [Opitutales bacterium]|nr:bile acid:sodium symporter [Opitutales bacterium]